VKGNGTASDLHSFLADSPGFSAVFATENAFGAEIPAKNAKERVKMLRGSDKSRRFRSPSP